jgi:hypothetical protein
VGQERWELDLDGVGQGLDRWGKGWARAATGLGWAGPWAGVGQAGQGQESRATGWQGPPWGWQVPGWDRARRLGRVTRQTWAHALLATCWA